MNEKTTCDILIRNTSILDENFQIRRNIFIAIQNGIILSITEKEPSGLTVTKIIDGKDLLWMPGLVDDHMHTGQQLLKGAGFLFILISYSRKSDTRFFLHVLSGTGQDLLSDIIP
mgnify:CR=1 FL=1